MFKWFEIITHRQKNDNLRKLDAAWVLINAHNMYFSVFHSATPYLDEALLFKTKNESKNMPDWVKENYRSYRIVLER